MRVRHNGTREKVVRDESTMADNWADSWAEGKSSLAQLVSMRVSIPRECQTGPTCPPHGNDRRAKHLKTNDYDRKRRT